MDSIIVFEGQIWAMRGGWYLYRDASAIGEELRVIVAVDSDEGERSGDEIFRDEAIVDGAAELGDLGADVGAEWSSGEDTAPSEREVDAHTVVTRVCSSIWRRLAHA